MRIKRDIINKFKEWKDAENPCRGKGRKLCQWKKYCCVQRTLPTQEAYVSRFSIYSKTAECWLVPRP